MSLAFKVGVTVTIVNPELKLSMPALPVSSPLVPVVRSIWSGLAFVPM